MIKVKTEIEELEFIQEQRNITTVKYDLNYTKIKKKFKSNNYYLLVIAYWLRYCNWFNAKFNSVKPIDNFISEE